MRRVPTLNEGLPASTPSWRSDIMVPNISLAGSIVDGVYRSLVAKQA